MKLQFWVADFFHAAKREKHVYVTLVQGEDEWIVWIKDGYDSPTHPSIGRVL